MKRPKPPEFDFCAKIDAQRSRRRVSPNEAARRSFRLPDPIRKHLFLEFLTTDKTTQLLAREFAISEPAVSYYRKKWRNEILAARRKGEPFLRYRKDGTLVYGFSSKESF